MKVLIVEDEKLASERLITLLHQYDEQIKVVACLESIEDTVQFLQTHPHPDLLLLDIHLSDGHSFEIFKKISYNKPIIFTTAFDQYSLDAFKLFSIDYILKPVSLESLACAIQKLNSINNNFTPVTYSTLSNQQEKNQFKKRFLGKVGQRLFFINTENISFFEANNKIVYLIDKDANKYIVEYTMEQLQHLLPPKQFFRLNRTFIINIDAVQHVKPWHNNRLKVSVSGLQIDNEMIVSREKVPDFKLWAEA